MRGELFELNQVENDRLIMEAHQKRQDLIDFAVRRFAPHLEGRLDTQVVHLYSTNASLRKEIRTITGGKTIVVEHVAAGLRSPRGVIHEVVQDSVVKLDIPRVVDIVATKSALNKRVEWLCAKLQALPVVLPEASDYLVARLKKQRVLTIVGGDQA